MDEISAEISPSVEDTQIESTKKQIKEKCTYVQEKLQKMSQKLNAVKEDQNLNCTENVASTSQQCNSAQSNSPQSEKQRIKDKINRVKKKFAKMNMKINGVPDTAAPKRMIQTPARSRSNSDRSSLINERTDAADLLRSQSVSISTSTLISEDNPNSASGATKESRRSKKRRRQNQTKDRIMEDVYNLELENDFKLNAETLLVLDLLYLPEDQHEAFLIKRAKNMRIIIENPESHKLELNPKLAKLKSIVLCGDKVWEINDSMKQRVQDIANIKLPKVEAPKKDKIRPVFEELVNAVVSEGLSEEVKEKFAFAVTPRKLRTWDYFNSSKFTKSLEEFAQKCVDANLGVIIEGEIRVNAKNNDQAFIRHVHGEKDAMFSSLLIRKCALHGDIVRAFIRINASDGNKEVPTERNVSTDLVAEEDDDEPLEIVPERSAKAFVISISEKVHNRRCVGSFLSYRLDSDYITFVPRDMKMPNIRIYKDHWPEHFIKGNMEKIQDVLYVAEIIDWIGDICIGKILQPVGKCGELEAENVAILLQNKLSVLPYEDRFNEMFYGPLQISEKELQGREDLRAECIFTIDPLTARDLDDAMSCKRLPNGNYEIGVHISDVAHFLQEDSELDHIVRQRTTSIYMVNEVYHMLPKPLCLKCSLLPGEDKFAFSVIWEITPTADVVKTKFCRSLINSCTQLAYEHAQKIIDYPDKDFTENDFPTIFNGFTPSDIVEKVKVLHSLALLLRKGRFDNGAIKINRPKLYFELDPDSGQPISYGICQLDTANFLIEEFMLLANQYVAKFIYDHFPEVSLLRHHEPPLPNVLKYLKERLTNLGIDLDISSSKALYESLLKIVQDSEDKELMEICLSHIISKPMTRAKYCCSASKESVADFWHYALSIPMYTHFTSPIRRYPDVLVHRVLSAALEYTPQPKLTAKELQKIATICNEHKVNAKTAGDDSSHLYFLHYIKSKQSLIVRAAVLEMWLHAMEVILIETGHIIRVPYPKEGKTNAKILFNNKTKPYTAQLILTNAPNSNPKELKMFSEIYVEIYVEKNNKLKGRLAIPSSSSTEKVSSDCQDSGKEESLPGVEKPPEVSCEDPIDEASSIRDNLSTLEISGENTTTTQDDAVSVSNVDRENSEHALNSNPSNSKDSSRTIEAESCDSCVETINNAMVDQSIEINSLGTEDNGTKLIDISQTCETLSESVPKIQKDITPPPSAGEEANSIRSPEKSDDPMISTPSTEIIETIKEVNLQSPESIGAITETSDQKLVQNDDSSKSLSSACKPF